MYILDSLMKKVENKINLLLPKEWYRYQMND